MRTEADNLALIRRFWQDLYDREYEKVGSYFADDGLYEDVPAPDNGAVGPQAVVARLRLGWDPVEKHVHHIYRMVADDKTVMTEHREDWHFHTGEVVELPFVSVHEVNEQGKLNLWRDYWDMNTLMSGVPKWWVERIMQGAE